ncbi:WD40 repeat-like protein [Pyrenochaeta sp. DS3sAY3a]|nr:WD40 repeat-like protein [Pyrenochaeta sp. DS3sAY3a]
MADGPLPQRLAIHNTTATAGGQSFAGFNLGTINYANNNNNDLNDVLLKSLPTAAEAQFSAYQRQHVPKCHPDTRIDLLEDIYKWAADDESPVIFWLRGMAGTGKSTVAHTVAAEYSARSRLAGSFFFSRDGGDVSHAGKFITTIAVQLANIIPALKTQICAAIQKRNDIASQSLDDQWHALVLNPLISVERKESLARFLVVIDALDECKDQKNIQIILRLLSRIQSSKVTQLRVLLTSRPEVAIRRGFDQMRQYEHQDFALHDIEKSIIEHDVTTFLRHNLQAIGRNFGFTAGWPEETHISQLFKSSGGLFIWAATASRFIEEDSQLARTRLESLLQIRNDTLPPERKLDEIYTTVLSNSLRGVYSQPEIQMLNKQFRDIVGTVVTLLDPLSVSSLAGLLGKDVETLKLTLSNLHSVLDVPANDTKAIRILHPSFRDFLLNPERCLNPQFCVDEQLAHRHLYRSCLRIMIANLKRDICNLEHAGILLDEVDRSKVNNCIPAQVRYACRFWVHHYERSGDEENYDLIELFFKNYFLNWIEALTLLECGSDAISMIHTLNSTFAASTPNHSGATVWRLISKNQNNVTQKGASQSDNFLSTVASTLSRMKRKKPNTDAFTNNTITRDLVNDAARFVQYFRPIIGRAPLQLYSAGIIFSPMKSLTKHWARKMGYPIQILSTAQVSENWGPCLERLTGRFGDITCLTFSPDGKTFASASWKGTISLWDAGSRRPLQTLCDGAYVTNLVFSSDGQTLASWCSGGGARLWDTGSGMCLQDFESFWPNNTRMEFSSMEFSPQSGYLVIGAREKSIKLIDVNSGDSSRILSTYLESISSVTFSPDWKIIVASGIMSGAEGREVGGFMQLWDTESWKVTESLRGHEKRIGTVAFSPNSELFASGSYDKTVKLWEVEKCRSFLKSDQHNGPDMDHGKKWRSVAPSLTYKSDINIRAVVFSPSGKLLALGATGEIRLVDVGSGQMLRCFTTSGSFYALAFSPDGQTLASGGYSFHGDLRLWDLHFLPTVNCWLWYEVLIPSSY